MDKKINIGITPLSEDEIRSRNIGLDDLWLIRIGDHILGPYLTVDLAEYAKDNEEFFESVFAFHVETEKWKPFFSVKYFQRRTPKLVPVQSLEKDTLWFVLKEGRKEGPFSFEDIKVEVQNNHLLLSDQISSDGNNWIKIYQHHEFDRRHFFNKNEKLPFSPSEDTFTNSKNKTEEILDKLKEIKNKESAILASFANLRSNPNRANNSEGPEIEVIEKEEPKEKIQLKFLNYFKSLNQKTKLIFALSGLSIFLFIFLITNYSNDKSALNDSFSNKSTNSKENKKTTQKQSLDTKDFNQIGNTNKSKNSNKRPQRNTANVSPKKKLTPPSTSPNFRKRSRSNKVKHVNRGRSRSRSRSLSNVDEEDYNDRNDYPEEDYSNQYDNQNRDYNNEERAYDEPAQKQNLLEPERPIEHQDYEDPRADDNYEEPREVEY